jgi:fatty-acyl-CoA synthase
MQGLMMDMPLLISGLIQHADRHHGAAEIVSKTVEGGSHRYTYREAHARARRLANALQKLGVRMHDRVATLAWNDFRHLGGFIPFLTHGHRSPVRGQTDVRAFANFSF